MNCVIYTTLDRSSLRSTSVKKMFQGFSTFMSQYGLVGPWRFSHPSVRQYSFFSHAHRSFSCIDYFLIDKKLIPVSDHATVVLDLHFSMKLKEFSHWRLDPLYLADDNFCKHISESITFFCETNKSDKPPHPYCGKLSKPT